MSDRTFHSPAGPGGVGVQGGPGSALQVLTSCQSSLLRSPPHPDTHRSESLSLCSRRVSDTLSHYPPEGGGEPGTPQPNYSRACQRRGRGRYQRQEREGAPRRVASFPVQPPHHHHRASPVVGAQFTPVHATTTTGLWAGEVVELRGICPWGGREEDGRVKLAWQWREVVRTRLLGA